MKTKLSPTTKPPEFRDDVKRLGSQAQPADAGHGGDGGGGPPTYTRVDLNIYRRFRRYYVYLMRLGQRRFVGSFDTLQEARKVRDEHTKANPARKPWSIANVGRVIKTRKDYYMEHKAKGICTSCKDPAEPGRVLCEGCAYVQKMKREARKAE